MQAKLEKQFTSGLSYLASYTWSHNLDDSIASAFRRRHHYCMWQIISTTHEITNATKDVNQRFTFNGSYELPFGRGRKFMNTTPVWLDEIAGGWRTDLTFVSQSGLPFTVTTNGINTPSGQNQARSILVGDPYATGGSPNATNPQLTSCPTSVKNRTHWYNACAFNNPLNGAATVNLNNGIGSFPTGVVNGVTVPIPVSDEATALKYLGGKSNNIRGPGYERINMGLGKQFTTWREQYVQFRADAFNLFNHPTLANPSNTGLSATADRSRDRSACRRTFLMRGSSSCRQNTCSSVIASAQ